MATRVGTHHVNDFIEVRDNFFLLLLLLLSVSVRFIFGMVGFFFRLILLNFAAALK